jgi:energy-coupling factor transporter ATP-binding protein EcfA2
LKVTDSVAIKHFGHRPQEWLVSEWVPRSSLTIVAGSPESGKSTALRTLAVALANGTPSEWLGFPLGKFEDSFHFPRTGVLALFMEESQDEVKRHLVSLGMDGAAPLYLLELEGGEDPVLALDQAMTEYRPGLVVIDTFGEFCGVQEINSYGETVEKLQALRALSNKHRAALILTHHTPKNQTSAENALLGSTGIRASVDSAAVLRALPRTRTRLLEPSKVRTGKRFEAIAVGVDEKGASFKMGSAEEAQAREACQWFAELIEAEGNPMSKGELAQNTGMAFPDVARAVMLDPDRRLEKVRSKTSVKYTLAYPTLAEQAEKEGTWEENL